ncbi:MAG: hypothetical protein DRP01_00140 [Archaeoglobales archaeon]|nr:MAG: hypothetical protein DRP01_00140 [Archaeoglobales archaeon]
MPFESKAQQRWMFAKHPAMAKEWAAHTPGIKKLPEKKMKKKNSGTRKVGMLAAQEPNLGTPDPTGGTQMSTTAAQMSNAQNLTPKLTVPKPPEQASGGTLGKQSMAASPARNTSTIPFREDGSAPAIPDGTNNEMNVLEGETSAFDSDDRLENDYSLETMGYSTPALPNAEGEHAMRTTTKVSNELEGLLNHLGATEEKTAGISPKMVKSLISSGSSLSTFHDHEKERKSRRKKGMLTKVSEGSGPMDEMKAQHMTEAHEQKMRHNEEIHQLKIQNMGQSQQAGAEEGVEELPPPPAPLEPEHEQSVLQTALQNLKDKQVQMGPL